MNVRMGLENGRYRTFTDKMQQSSATIAPKEFIRSQPMESQSLFGQSCHELRRDHPDVGWLL